MDGITEHGLRFSQHVPSFCVVQQPSAGLGRHIVEVSRSHTTGRTPLKEWVISLSQRALPTQHTTKQGVNIHAVSGIQTHGPSNRAPLVIRPPRSVVTNFTFPFKHYKVKPPESFWIPMKFGVMGQRRDFSCGFSFYWKGIKYITLCEVLSAFSQPGHRWEYLLRNLEYKLRYDLLL
jgi:hypothetical protein